MSLKDLNKLYKDTVGRNVDAGGYDYWKPRLESGEITLDKIKNLLVASDEYKDRAKAVKEHKDSGRGNPSEATLDDLGSAYKGALMSDSVAKDVAITPAASASTAKAPSSSSSNYVHPTGQDFIDEVFEGYNSSAAGNFINKGEPGYDNETAKQQVAGILDIQGTAGDTQAQAAEILDAAPAGTDMKTLLQNLATKSASEIQEGTYQDPNKGHTFLPAVAAGTKTATIEDLYIHGLMREPDQSGVDWWKDPKNSLGEGVDIQDIAKNFLAGSESQIHQAFDANFGRMAGAEGLDYFGGIDATGDVTTDDERTAAAQGKTLSEYIGDILSYRGGTINPETGKEWAVSAETLVRDDLYNIAGEASTVDKRDPNFYTAPKLSEVAEYRDRIRDARKAGDGAAAEAAVTAEITSKAHQLVGANRGDVDDDEFVTGEGATMMGRILSDVEQEQGHAAGLTADDWYDDTKGKVWGALTTELDKTTLPIEQAGLGYKGAETLKQLAEERGEIFDISNYRMYNQKYLDEGGVKYDNDEWTYKPVKTNLPTDIPIDKQKVDYMPGLTSDVQLPDDVKYADRAKEFQTEYDKPQTTKTAEGQAGQRFTGTSAKGVRMKRSKASRMGTIRGTKQLGREQQTKSLNI